MIVTLGHPRMITVTLGHKEMRETPGCCKMMTLTLEVHKTVTL